MARKLAAVAFSLGCLHASSLMALGLGEIKLESFLNEPLKASIDLLNMGGLHPDEIKIRLGTSDDFDKLGLDRAYFLTSIKFEVSGNDSGGARIVISSEEAVLEPYLDFIVEARWPSGRLLREYTVLVDPPVFSQGAQVVSASQRVEEVEGIAAPAKKNRQVAAGVNEDDATIGNWGAEESSTGGTRVDVRESNLAPGAMPKRRYNAATSPAPTPGSRYMIGRDQTLWGIASRAKPAGASVHQTMLDIQRLNPDAFINGNINKIKAGYIIYLPSAGDISSTDLSTTLAEVREQNAAWREGRDVHPTAAKHPSLRISAEPEESAEAAGTKASAPGTDQPLAAVASPPASSASAAVAPVVNTASSGPADAQERLAAIEEQLATLQRIVSLKDDQIAALQGALANAGIAAGEKGATDATSSVGDAPVAPATVPLPAENGTAVENAAVTVPGTAPEPNVLPAGGTQAAAPEPAAKAVPTKASPATASGNDWMSYLLYGLGALALGIAGFVFSRRRGGDQQQTATARRTAPKDDVFSDVQLKHQSIKVEAPEQEVDELAASQRDNRGYGERKHDEYAADIDAADALAEADIYIAYGRHQQAIDLLNNALASEPGNPVYRLKLLEIYTERNNHAAASSQLAKIRSMGDADSIARAESLMDRLQGEGEPDLPKTSVSTPAVTGQRLSPNPLEMMPDSTESLDEKFSGLEIEGRATSGDDDDLDLSGDFATRQPTGYEDEELVIAADSNGLSTKLDLARAYLDMGDDDGARQILDEVVAEGSGELKAEARALLDRIGG